MSIRTGIFLTFAAYILWQMAKKAKLAFKLSHTGTRFKLVGTSMLVYIQLTNSSSESATVDNIEGNINYAGEAVARVEFRNPITITPQSITEIELKVIPTVNGFLQIIDKVLDGKFQNFFFNGILKVDGVPIPIRKELTYE